MNLDHVIVVDVETSGLDPLRHGILEIGAIELVGEREFSIRVRLSWELECDAKALLVNGLTEEGARNAHLSNEVEMLEQFYDCFGWESFLLAGQNPHFDRSMLAAVMNRAPSSAWPRLKSRVLDMHSVAIAYAPWAHLEIESSMVSPQFLTHSKWTEQDTRELDSTRIYELLGMAPELRPHRALTGARMERTALRKMLQIE